MISATAPGKLVLLGEYSVLHGSASLVAAVNRRARVELTPAKQTTVDAEALGVLGIEIDLTHRGGVWKATPHSAEGKLGLVACALETVAEWLHVQGSKVPSAHLSVDTSSFFERGQKLGFGSSAAVVVALISAYVLGHSSAATRKDVFDLALKAHRAFQGGTGSGVDVASCTYGGLLQYRMGKPVKMLALPQDLFIGWVWVGNAASTVALVGGVSAAAAKDGGVLESIEKLANRTAQGISALEENRTDLFILNVAEFSAEFEELGVRSSQPLMTFTHQEIRSRVLSLGGSYKPSGAGGGDLGVFFSNDPRILEDIQSQLNVSGYLTGTLVIDQGVEVST